MKPDARMPIKTISLNVYGADLNLSLKTNGIKHAVIPAILHIFMIELFN